MERFQKSWADANNKIQLADHMFTMTYPLVKDPKMLINIAHNVSLSMEFLMTSVLEFERLFKRIPAYSEDFSGKLVVFKTKVMRNYELSSDHVNTMTELRNILTKRDESPMEFVRKDKVVIADEEYDLRLLSPNDIKRFIKAAKTFRNVVKPIVAKNE